MNESQDDERRLRQRDALVRLARSEVLASPDHLKAMQLVAETVAEALRVSRVSIWRYYAAPSAIQCLALHDVSGVEAPPEVVLQREHYPAYFDALDTSDVIASADASSDPRTREFRVGYLDVHNIASMLDAPIRLGGELRGVICHEQVGARRPWHADEEAFAIAVASLVASVLERWQRQLAESALERSAQDFRVLFAQNPLPMWVFDLQTFRFLTVNDAAVRYYGYSRDEFLRMTIADIRPPEDVPLLRARRPASETELYAAGVWRHRRKDGSILFAKITARPLVFQGRRAELILAEDVTESRRAQEALQESEMRFRQLAETIPDVFWLMNASDRSFLYVSPAYQNVWGRPVDALLTAPQTWLETVHPDDRERIGNVLRSTPAESTYEIEFRIVRPDGTTRWIRDKAFPVHDADGRVARLAGLASDITARKQLEQQFFRAQRIESVGTLASGVAHDLNNILTPMLGAAGLLKSSALNPDDAQLVELVEESARRGAAIVRQLLTFARGAGGERTMVQPSHVLKEVARLIGETFPRNLTITLNAPADLACVSADSTQLHQVLVNLCVNARDAMRGGGNLTLGAENVVLPDPCVKGAPPGASGPHVRFLVRDTGEGIPPEIVDRIFDPFFTTKDPGHGTGLGLSTVLGITRDHGGFLHVESQPGRGTEFQVCLPAVAAASPGALSREFAIQRGRGELVLIVDDEASVRSTLQEVFQRHGYRVLLADGGDEALRQFAAHRSTIGLVVTDLMMPRMSGLELRDSLRLARPDLPLILLTGTAETAPLPADDFCDVVAKPCSPAQLLALARRVLDGNSPRPTSSQDQA